MTGKPEIIEIRKIWDKARHNAFTDLARFRGQWFLSFREGTSHVSGDGVVRVLTSSDGEAWTPLPQFSSSFDPLVNLCDPHMCITPDDELMFHVPAWNPCCPEQQEEMCQTVAWFSSDGETWRGPEKIGDVNRKMYRARRHKGIGYSVACATRKDLWGSLFLYKSFDGKRWQRERDPIYTDSEHPNEAQLLFLRDNRCICLLRRNWRHPEDHDDRGWLRLAGLGVASPPYTEWAWKDLSVSIGGPNLVQLPDERIVAGVRLWDGKGWGEQHLALCWVDVKEGRIEEFLRLPSGGDSTYPGLVFHDDVLWVSYYSSHEGKASVYLARVRIR